MSGKKIALLFAAAMALYSGRALAQSQNEPRTGLIYSLSPNSGIFSSLEESFKGPANLNISEMRFGVIHETRSGDEWGAIFSRKRVAGSVDLTETAWFDEPPTRQVIGYSTEPPGYRFETLSGRVGRAPRGDIYRMNGSYLMAIEVHWYKPFSVGRVNIGPSVGFGYSWRHGSVKKETLSPYAVYNPDFDVRQSIRTSKVPADKAYESAGAPPVLGGIAGQVEITASAAVHRNLEIRASGGVGFHGPTLVASIVYYPPLLQK